MMIYPGLLFLVCFIVIQGALGCSDLDNVNVCRQFEREGECIASPGYMMNFCAKSCGWCPSVTLCEGEDMLIRCPTPAHALKITSVFFGRRDLAVCPHKHADRTDCSAPEALMRVRKVCEGRQFCHLTAADNFGPDPCVGTYKYLQVEYECVECMNRFPNEPGCQRQLRSGECWNMRSWVRDECFMTCSACNHSECINPYNDLEMCDYWALRGECEENPLWMQNQCQMSCRVCKQSEHAQPKPEPLYVSHETICERNETLLDCGSPNKALRILSATYGRFNNATCPHESVGAWEESCWSQEGVLARLQEVCDGRMSCYVGVYDNLGDDPCPGIHKYLSLDYVCQDCTDSPQTEATPGVCDTWQEMGMCDSEELAGFMDNYCYKTCSNCSNSECINPHGDDSSCDYWAIKGECSSNKQWMEENCPMSCRTCKELDKLPPPLPIKECVNEHMSGAQCEGWAARGQCEENPEFMLDKCYRACARCQQSPLTRTLVCEGERMVLRCFGGRRIAVQEVVYGRTDANLCPHEKGKDTECYGQEAEVVTRAACEGRSECSVNVNIETLGDPCPGVYKYISVTYTCLE